MKKTTFLNIHTLVLTYIIYSLGLLLGHSQAYDLVWSEDFTNSYSDDWVFETGRGSNGWGNNELQYYRKENVSIENGHLVLTAKKEDYNNANYTSVRMKTQGTKSWKYGKIEARIKMPSFKGVWPAFWMLGDNIGSAGWPECGEIDIMEHVNTETRAYGTVHFTNSNNLYEHIGGNKTIDMDVYHTYTIEWSAQKIVWFIDGEQYHEINIANGSNGTSEFHKPFFLLLNMAVGGNWPGFTIDDSALPAKMYVDYVRVYQKEQDIVVIDPTTSLLIEAEDYTNMQGVEQETTTDTNGGKNVGFVDTTDWMSYNNVLQVAETSDYKIEYRVASKDGGGQLSADLNSGAIQLGKLDVPQTGGWQEWTTISHTVSVNPGIYDFGIYAQIGGWNINWIKITKLETLSTGDVAVLSNIRSTCYPNPVQSKLYIEGSTATVYTVMDMSGKKYTVLLQPDGSLDLSQIPKGMYYVTEESGIIQEKVIKQ